MAWRLNSFFGCGKLETGGRVVGGIQLGVAIFVIISAILGIVGCIIRINDPKTSPHDISIAKTALIYLIVFASGSFIDLISSIFLLVGTNKGNPRYILVWLIITFVTTLVYLLLNILDFNVISFVGTLIGTAIMIYFYLCIYSLYVKFKEEEPLLPGGRQNYESIPSSA